VSQAANFLGVSETQIRLLADSGEIKTVKTVGAHRRICAHSLFQWQTGLTVQDLSEGDNTGKQGLLIGLCRVSSRKQASPNGENKSSLEHQGDHVKDYCRKKYGREPDELLLHCRSGLNFSDGNFLALIRRIVSGNLRGATIVLTHPDRFARAARQLIEFLCDMGGVTIEYVFKDEESTDAQKEMVEDFLAIATFYTAKNSGRKAALVCRIDLQPEHLALAFTLKKKKGMGYQAIADYLKAKGMVSEKGKTYSPQIVRKCLVANWAVLELGVA
jgi:excisionase family DNA binding protein